MVCGVYVQRCTCTIHTVQYVLYTILYIHTCTHMSVCLWSRLCPLCHVSQNSGGCAKRSGQVRSRCHLLLGPDQQVQRTNKCPIVSATLNHIQSSRTALSPTVDCQLQYSLNMAGVRLRVNGRADQPDLIANTALHNGMM